VRLDKGKRRRKETLENTSVRDKQEKETGKEAGKVSWKPRTLNKVIRT
jgi:hypothetical protein